jgi:hypothetical protein
MCHRRRQDERAQRRQRHVAPHDVPEARGPSESEATIDGKVIAQYGPNLAKTKFLARYNTVNQVDSLHGGTTPAHAVREWEARKRFAVT